MITLPFPSSGTLYGVGLGPGDPALITLKAARLIEETPAIAYFAKKGGSCHARTIAACLITPQHEEIAFHYPLTTEIPFSDPAYKDALAPFYARCAERIAAVLRKGRNLALLCEGDPFFYGSFMHIFIRLKDHFTVETIPGISGMAGAWSAAGQPIAWGDDCLTVLPGTLPREMLEQRLKNTEAAIIMKLGRNFAKVRAAVMHAGLMERAFYAEHATMTGQNIIPLAEKRGDAAPYFSLILIPGNGRRP